MDLMRVLDKCKWKLRKHLCVSLSVKNAHQLCVLFTCVSSNLMYGCCWCCCGCSCPCIPAVPLCPADEICCRNCSTNMSCTVWLTSLYRTSCATIRCSLSRSGCSKTAPQPCTKQTSDGRWLAAGCAPDGREVCACCPCSVCSFFERRARGFFAIRVAAVAVDSPAGCALTRCWSSWTRSTNSSRHWRCGHANWRLMYLHTCSSDTHGTVEIHTNDTDTHKRVLLIYPVRSLEFATSLKLHDRHDSIRK